MKKVIQLLAVCMFVVTAANAQEVKKKSCCSADSAAKKVEMLKKNLDLTDEQSVQLTAVFQGREEEAQDKLKTILTPTQYAKYEEMKKSCSAEKKSCCKKDKKSCDKDKKSCSKDKKSCCKKDKKSCSKDSEKKSCSKDGKKKSCCKSKK